MTRLCGEHCVPSGAASADCGGGHVCNISTDTNPCVSKDKDSTIVTQRQDNGRSSDVTNMDVDGCSEDQVKGIRVYFRPFRSILPLSPPPPIMGDSII